MFRVVYSFSRIKGMASRVDLDLVKQDWYGCGWRDFRSKT